MLDPDVRVSRRPGSPLRVDVYRAALRRKNSLIARANALFDGFWLGMLDRDSLAQFDEAHYETRRERVGGGAAYRYDDDQWNLRGLFAWERAAVEEHFPSNGRIVVTGAGGGREVLALLERGYDAVGYEPHPRLVRAGSALLEERGHPHRLFLSRRDTFPAEAGACDAVVVGWGSYALMPGRRRRIEFLRGARACLPVGGPVLVSFFAREGGERLLTTVSRTANLLRRVRRSEPAEVGDALNPNFVHLFADEELATELEAAGFMIHAYHRHPYGHAVARAAAPATSSGQG
jgi:hypothetical protein